MVCSFTALNSINAIYFYNLLSQEEHSIKVVKLANEQIANYEAEVCNVKICVHQETLTVMGSTVIHFGGKKKHYNVR